jgi:uncharacterized protein
MKMNRRAFLKNFGRVVLGGGLALAGGYGYSTQIEPDWLTVERVQIPLKQLRPALEGFRIVQMSDFHLYPLYPA